MATILTDVIPAPGRRRPDTPPRTCCSTPTRRSPPNTPPPRACCAAGPERPRPPDPTATCCASRCSAAPPGSPRRCGTGRPAAGTGSAPPPSPPAPPSTPSTPSPSPPWWPAPPAARTRPARRPHLPGRRLGRPDRGDPRPPPVAHRRPRRPVPARRAVAAARPPAAPHPEEPRRPRPRPVRRVLAGTARLVPAALVGRRPGPARRGLRHRHPRRTDHRRAVRPPAAPGTAALPLHPWQARELTLRPAVAELLDQGLLTDLGQHGEPWHPTSSVRTVCRPGTPWMLKLSLGLRITNSRRENLRKELHRGVEVHRLLEAGLARRWQAVHPGFDIVRDPAWIGVDHPALGDPNGLDTVLREMPFGPADRALCVAGLVAEQPVDRSGSQLAQVLGELAARSGRPTATVATEWFLRYLDAVVLPVLWLDGQAGIALEAHQQNSLVLLDRQGWPVGGRYRDNQGYYFRASHADRLHRLLPGLGAHSDTFVPDQVADERFAYYLGINHVLGLIGAFGSQQLADEQLLLAALRRFLAGPAATATGSALPAHLLDAPTLRCKANLLTRLHGLDELVGPVETQSVYVEIDNPVARA
ncbi:putative siderophore biosynthesis protein [Kitasatospora cheerisanensis KCTC 2395]|uniref:Putative siderophore biosynthesis protein n=1 Tax=Kitasatospora cheerisanensis KCTC 2395 TaxID=1348663 RepID=A0A066YXT3_9ACTN|nr:putative siderophore biosynthesis protein [Kitasatospora cheerisanensis KCTC 2395]